MTPKVFPALAGCSWPALMAGFGISGLSVQFVFLMLHAGSWMCRVHLIDQASLHELLPSRRDLSDRPAFKVQPLGVPRDHGC